jgi:hypothetical protein
LKGASVHHQQGVRQDTETDMAKRAVELERQRLDLELDGELEATFPASDALKITRRHSDRFERGEQPKIKKSGQHLVRRKLVSPLDSKNIVP